MMSDKQNRPNVLFILTDDQGWWSLGCYGNKEIKTPNLDKLAARGMRFNNFFCATPVCSPSRATFLTGRIPSQHGVHDWVHGGNVDPGAIKYIEGETAYSDILADNGYTCGISGKWHLGASDYPQHSFSHWYVHRQGGGAYMGPDMVRDGKLQQEKGYITNLITDNALEFLDVNGKDPFYLSVHYTAPHSPWDEKEHLPEYFHMYDDCPFESCPQEPKHSWAIHLTDKCLNNREMLQGYAAAITAMDSAVGRILDKLDELGIRDNTLIAFASDNGFSCGHHGFWGKGNGTFPLNMYENSIKVPAIFSHPGRIQENSVSDDMVSAYDFMPTLLDYLDLPMPETGNLPGQTFLPVLEGKRSSGRDSVVIFDEYGNTRMIRTGKWKYVQRYPDGPNELWDLTNDPDERTNLIDDPGSQTKIVELRGELEEWFDTYTDPERDGRCFPVDGKGQFELCRIKDNSYY